MENLTQEEIDLILSTIGSDTQENTLQQQAKIAQALRGYQPETSMQAGRVVVPKVGSIIGGIFQRGKGERDYAAAQESLKALNTGRQKAASTYLNKLLTQDPSAMDINL